MDCETIKHVSWDHYAAIVAGRVAAIYCRKPGIAKAEKHVRVARLLGATASVEWAGEGVCPKCGRFEYFPRGQK